MQAPMELESKQQDEQPASNAVLGGFVPNAVDLSRWHVNLAVEMREYDAEDAEDEVALPETESISKARLARVILPSGTVILCSAAVLLRHCLALKQYAEQLQNDAVHLNFTPKALFPDQVLIDFFSKLHQHHLNEDENLAGKEGWEPEWCYLAQALNIAGRYQEAQRSLNRRFERGERMWDWIRLLRQSTPDDRRFRTEVVNALTGVPKQHMQAAISVEYLGDAFSILDEDDWMLLANSRWIFRFKEGLDTTPLLEEEKDEEGAPVRFKFPNMTFKAIRLQKRDEPSDEERTVTIKAAENLAPAQQVHIVVSPHLTIVGSAEVLKGYSRVVESLAADGAGEAPLVVRLEGTQHMKEKEVIQFFEAFHSEQGLSSVKPALWAISWVHLADQLQMEALMEPLGHWFWNLREIIFAKDFWSWVAATRLRSMQKYRPSSAPSTATREDVFAMLENFPHSRLYRAVVHEREQFLKDYNVTHIVRLLHLCA